jgi:peptidoglycan hydrolase-like protein with peptidoglycan-binding domain
MSLSTIQQGLKSLGHDPGPADGKWGPRTEGAVKGLLAAKGGRGPVPGVADVLPVPLTTSLILQGRARTPVREIVVHCSATRKDWMDEATFAARFAEIRRWHMVDRGWRTIGYHWVIDRDGAIKAGRAENEIGAGVEGHNSGVIHACLIGGHGSASTDGFLEHFTSAQDVALRKLIAGVRLRTQITTISGHNQYANKACPGFSVPHWLEDVA